ncbi:ENTH-domain-containing protein [Gigaspora margarita]|uniref:ENTH-domain-containing protein n=1 Tax=Gigaspora margarita TaxID=4874 RepID=A0A8H4AKQ5_GIGMA|nr:ENTH-domain-containing protein [Gigaspora margarita]
MRDRLTGSNELPGSISRNIDQANDYYDHAGNLDDEDADIKKAMEESLKTANESEKNSKKEKEDLERAIKLSEEEEEKRRTMLEKQNEKLLFDSSYSSNTSQLTQQQQLLQQQQQTDFFGNPITSFANPQFNLLNQYSGNQNSKQLDPFGLVDDQALINNQSQYLNNPYQLQQQSINPYQQSSTLQTNVSIGSNNPFGPFSQQQLQQQQLQQQQLQQQQLQQQQLQQQQLQQQQLQQQQLQQQQLQQQQLQRANFGTTSYPTNNSITSSGSLASNFSSPNLTTSTTSFDVFNSSKQQPVLKPNSTDEKHPELAALFGNIGEGGGMDTFGNTGNLRVPTGSGFANSVLNEPSNSIHSPRRSNSTGNLSQQNPFLNSGDTNNVSSGTFNTLPSNFNSSFTNVNQPASSFSTSSYTTTSLPTSNSLIDLDTGSFSSQASKNPFQTQQTISSNDINKPKSLMDIQREQQLLQQSQGFNQGTNVGFGNPWLS